MESLISGRSILIILLLSSCSFIVDSSMQIQMQPPPSSVNRRNGTVNIDPVPVMPQVDPKEQEKPEFLASHNKVRLHFNQPPFVWDSNLALYSRRYAEKRSQDCSLIHSNGPYGENIFWGGGNQWKPAEVVRLWVREHRNYDRATNKCMDGKLCGHYTQIVWRDSVRLGCALLQCNSGDMFGICSYDPPGNYVGESPFNPGIRL